MNNEKLIDKIANHLKEDCQGSTDYLSGINDGVYKTLHYCLDKRITLPVADVREKAKEFMLKMSQEPSMISTESMLVKFYCDMNGIVKRINTLEHRKETITLREQFIQETGNPTTVCSDGESFTVEYVEWVERKLYNITDKKGDEPQTVVEKFTDNGEHSHWDLVNKETGEVKIPICPDCDKELTQLNDNEYFCDNFACSNENSFKYNENGELIQEKSPFTKINLPDYE